MLEDIAMLYPELFAQLEKARWNMATDIPWDQFDVSLLTDEQAETVKMNAITDISIQTGLSEKTVYNMVQHPESFGYGISKKSNKKNNNK